MRKPGRVLTRGVALAVLSLVLAACAARGYRSDSYYPSGYVYFPNYVGGGLANGYYYGPRNERDRPASETDFDWGGTSRRP